MHQNLMKHSHFSDKNSQELTGFRVFATIEEEVLAAVQSVALADRSSYGRVKVTGADSIDLLHRISTNDLTKLRPGTALPTIFVNEKGRLIDRHRLKIDKQGDKERQTARQKVIQRAKHRPRQRQGSRIMR